MNIWKVASVSLCAKEREEKILKEEKRERDFELAIFKVILSSLDWKVI